MLHEGNHYLLENKFCRYSLYIFQIDEDLYDTFKNEDDEFLAIQCSNKERHGIVRDAARAVSIQKHDVSIKNFDSSGFISVALDSMQRTVPNHITGDIFQFSSKNYDMLKNMSGQVDFICFDHIRTCGQGDYTKKPESSLVPFIYICALLFLPEQGQIFIPNHKFFLDSIVVDKSDDSLFNPLLLEYFSARWVSEEEAVVMNPLYSAGDRVCPTQNRGQSHIFPSGKMFLLLTRLRIETSLCTPASTSLSHSGFGVCGVDIVKNIDAGNFNDSNNSSSFTVPESRSIVQEEMEVAHSESASAAVATEEPSSDDMEVAHLHGEDEVLQTNDSEARSSSSLMIPSSLSTTNSGTSNCWQQDQQNVTEPSHINMMYTVASGLDIPVGKLQALAEFWHADSTLSSQENPACLLATEDEIEFAHPHSDHKILQTKDIVQTTATKKGLYVSKYELEIAQLVNSNFRGSCHSSIHHSCSSSSDQKRLGIEASLSEDGIFRDKRKRSSSNINNFIDDDQSFISHCTNASLDDHPVNLSLFDNDDYFEWKKSVSHGKPVILCEKENTVSETSDSDHNVSPISLCSSSQCKPVILCDKVKSVLETSDSDPTIFPRSSSSFSHDKSVILSDEVNTGSETSGSGNPFIISGKVNTVSELSYSECTVVARSSSSPSNGNPVIISDEVSTLAGTSDSECTVVSRSSSSPSNGNPVSISDEVSTVAGTSDSEYTVVSRSSSSPSNGNPVNISDEVSTVAETSDSDRTAIYSSSSSVGKLDTISDGIDSFFETFDNFKCNESSVNISVSKRKGSRQQREGSRDKRLKFSDSDLSKIEKFEATFGEQIDPGDSADQPKCKMISLRRFNSYGGFKLCGTNTRYSRVRTGQSICISCIEKFSAILHNLTLAWDSRGLSTKSTHKCNSAQCQKKRAHLYSDDGIHGRLCGKCRSKVILRQLDPSDSLGLWDSLDRSGRR